MNREEALQFIGQSIKDDVDMARVADAIEAISAEPCDDYAIGVDNTGRFVKASEVFREPCEDAISRAAAIKAMDDLEQEDIELYGCPIPEGFDGRRAIEALQSLPSVTPKQNDVLNKIRAELIQSIQNGTLKIESGNEELFRIIDKHKAENAEQESEE